MCDNTASAHSDVDEFSHIARNVLRAALSVGAPRERANVAAAQPYLGFDSEGFKLAYASSSASTLSRRQRAPRALCTSKSKKDASAQRPAIGVKAQREQTSPWSPHRRHSHEHGCAPNTFSPLRLDDQPYRAESGGCGGLTMRANDPQSRPSRDAESRSRPQSEPVRLLLAAVMDIMAPSPWAILRFHI